MQKVRLAAGVGLLMASAMLVGSLAPAAGARQDPQTGRIRILFIGQLVGIVNLFTSWYTIEPRMTVQPVPCSLQQMLMTDAKRLVRLYVPRNYEEMVGKYDCVVVQDLGPDVLSPNFLPDFRRAILEEGLGAALAEFIFWVGNGNRIDLWMASTFYDIVPADIIYEKEIPQGQNSFYKLVGDNPILQLPGIEQHQMNGGHHGPMIARQGSEVLALWRGLEYPAVTFRKSGRGALIQIGHGFDNIPPSTLLDWTYSQDYAYNLVYGVTQQEIPKDLELVRKARSLFTTAAEKKSLVFAILEFAEEFGANTHPIAGEIGRLVERYAEGNSHYISGEYEQAAAVYQEIISEYDKLEAKALVLKDRALLWVYIIEWLSVSGTSMLSGFVLYSLMVRRRMFKAVESTRTVSKRKSM